VATSYINCTISIDWTAALGIRTVTVSGPYGSASLPGSFEVLGYDPPLVSGVIPNFGIQGEMGKSLVVTGAGFFPGITFEFLPLGNVGVTNVQYNNANAATVTVNIPPTALPQHYDVRGINPDNQDSILVEGFRVRPPDPFIDSIVPSQGFLGDLALPVRILGGNLVIIDSVDFGPGVTVHFVSAGDTEVDVNVDIPALMTSPCLAWT
jgi:hypothetical protein